MKFIGNTTYLLTIPTRVEWMQTKYAKRRVVHNSVRIRMVYCGGSYCDKDGHHISGGLWSHPFLEHPDYRYWEDIEFVDAQKVPSEWERERDREDTREEFEGCTTSREYRDRFVELYRHEEREEARAHVAEMQYYDQLWEDHGGPDPIPTHYN